MLLNELFLQEDGFLSPRELVKRPGRADLYLKKIQTSSPFTTMTGQQITIDPNEAKRISDLLQQPTPASPSTPIKTSDGNQILMKDIKKTGEFGGTGETKSGERTMANRGNTLEGVLGAAAISRLAARPGRRVEEQDLKRVIDMMAKKYPGDGKNVGGEVEFQAKGPASEYTDRFKLIVKLPAANYTDFADYNFMTQDKQMAGYIRNAIAFINEGGIIDRYARFFEQNQKADQVNVIADGVSDMSGRKTDIFMEYTDENGKRQTKRFDMSLKAGTTDQFGQVSAGGDTARSRKKAFSEWGWSAYKNLWSSFGIDVSDDADGYLKAPNLMTAVNNVYKTAFIKFQEQLAGSDDDQEKTWLRTFTNNIKEHGTYNDPAVQLAQFEQSKYYVLDFQKIDRLLDQDKLDLDVKMQYTKSKDGSTWPQILFYNVADNQVLIRIRAKYSTEKMNNLIEKGPYLKKILRVRGSSN